MNILQMLGLQKSDEDKQLDRYFEAKKKRKADTFMKQGGDRPTIGDVRPLESNMPRVVVPRELVPHNFANEWEGQSSWDKPVVSGGIRGRAPKPAVMRYDQEEELARTYFT